MSAPAPDPDTVQRILEERARALARTPDVQVPGETLECVVVALGLERYGLDVRQVQEVQALAGLTPVPGLPAIWAGLINLRGRLFPVLNLRRYLGLPAAPAEGAPGGQVALVSAGRLTLALWVDGVFAVRRLRLDELGPSLSEAGEAPTGARVVRGVTPDLLTVLDLDALLADPRLTVQAEAG